MLRINNFPKNFDFLFEIPQSEHTSALPSSEYRYCGVHVTHWEVMPYSLIYISQQECSLLHVVQTGYGAHPASYPMGARGSFLGGKAAGERSLPLTSCQCQGQENVNLYIHSLIRLHGLVLN
jgi:hypothetical protein